jgi:5-hydroxyisourate hydrolase-like protein (transthyretin family)
MKIGQIYILTLILSLIVLNINNSFSQAIKAVVAVTGSIKDEISKKPLSVSVKVTDNTGKKINSTKSNAYEDGYYFITGLIPGNTYNFEIVIDNYFKENIAISVPNSDKYLEISRDFNMKPLEKGVKLPLAVSPFEYNKTKLRFGSVVALERLANSLKNNPNVKFTILSYPDSNDDAAENKSLTKSRADALKDYFVVQGIDPLRIKIQDSETTDPNIPPPTEKRAKGKKYIGSTYIVINEF